MAYLGKQPAVQGKDAGPAQRLDNVSSSFNGTLTAFDMTLDGTTVTPHINNLAIYLNGVYQEPDNAYILSGSQMKFSEAPTSGMSFQGSILGDRRLMTPDNDTLKAAMVSSDLRTAISGSFTTVSSSLASRITSEEGEAEGTVISSSAQVIANLPTGVISGSGNLSASLPPGTMSGSAQTKINLPTGVISGSGNLSASLPPGTMSGSVQTAINLPTGTVSASMGVSGSSISTGSFGRVEVAGNLSVLGKGGNLFQVVSEVDSNQASSNSNSFAAKADPSPSITTTVLNSRVLIIGSAGYIWNGSDNCDLDFVRAVSGGATTTGITDPTRGLANCAATDADAWPGTIVFLDSPDVAAGTTITYQFCFKNGDDAATQYLGHDDVASTLTLMEVV